MNRLLNLTCALTLIFTAQQSMAADTDTAMQLVKDTTAAIMSTIKKEQPAIKKDPDYVFVLVDKIVLPHFDFTRMSKWTLGKYWRKANKDQQARFEGEFKMMLVRTYAKALADNYDQKVDFKSVKASKKRENEVTVNTEVAQSAGFPIPINYKMHAIDSKWKVYDVVIDGISLVANYRSSFAQQIRKDGIDNLIASLADRNKGQAQDKAK